MHTITLSKNDTGWLARFSDPAIAEVMGSDTIPTAFTPKAPLAKVRAELARLNPGTVILPADKNEGAAALTALCMQGFIGRAQRGALTSAMRREEGQYFADMLVTLKARIGAMPKVYEQDGLGDAAIVHLHYFAGGSANWWITEKDSEPGEPQHQAFGLADLFGDGGELGYISLKEATDCGAEIDLYWTPVTLGELRSKRGLS